MPRYFGTRIGAALAILPVLSALTGQPVQAAPPAKKGKATAPASALPAKAAPQGMLELSSGGNGRILTSRMSGTDSSRKILMALRMAIADYFDNAPKLTAVFADRQDQNLQAAFTANLKGVPVRGVMAIQMQGAAGQATLVFDRAAVFTKSFARLTQSVNGGGTGARGGGAPAPVHLTMHPITDGSGQIGLPPGWKVTDGYKGTVAAAGPDGAIIRLGMYDNIITPQGQLPGLPNPNIAVVDFSNTIRATLQYSEFQSRRAQRAGMPPSHVTRVWDTAPASFMPGRAAFMRFSFVSDGKSYEGLGLYSVMPVDNTMGLLYMSVVYAPQSVFKKDLPGMVAAWQSWGIKDSVFRERMNSALKSMKETGDIITGANANRQETYAHVNKAWDQVIRDESTWRDKDTGQRFTLRSGMPAPDGATGNLEPVPIGEL